MAIVIILAKKNSLYWVTKLIKVIMCELPHGSLGFYRCCCLLFPPSLFLLSLSCFPAPFLPVTHFCCCGPLCSRPWDFVGFKSVLLPLSPIITAQTEICMKKRRRRRRKTLRLSEEEGRRGGGGGGRHRGREKNVTAEAQRVGGECRRGRTWSWLRLFSTACLLSLGNANQAALPKPLSSPKLKV